MSLAVVCGVRSVIATVAWGSKNDWNKLSDEGDALAFWGYGNRTRALNTRLPVAVSRVVLQKLEQQVLG